MKKIVAYAAVLTLLTSASAFATDAGSQHTTTAGGVINAASTGGTTTQIAKLSNNVTAKIKWSNTSFASATKHLNGTKEYGTASNSTSIYAKELAAGTAAPSDVSASDSANFGSSWTAL